MEHLLVEHCPPQLKISMAFRHEDFTSGSSILCIALTALSVQIPKIIHALGIYHSVEQAFNTWINDCPISNCTMMSHLRYMLI